MFWSLFIHPRTRNITRPCMPIRGTGGSIVVKHSTHKPRYKGSDLVTSIGRKPRAPGKRKCQNIFLSRVNKYSCPCQTTSCWPMHTDQCVLTSACWPVNADQCMLTSACWPVHADQCMLTSACWPVNAEEGLAEQCILTSECWPMLRHALSYMHIIHYRIDYWDLCHNVSLTLTFVDNKLGCI